MKLKLKLLKIPFTLAFLNRKCFGDKFYKMYESVYTENYKTAEIKAYLNEWRDKPC